MSIGSQLGRLFREQAKDRNGRIRWWQHLYLFIDSAGRRKRKSNWKKEPWEARTDEATGREYSIYKGRGAQCFHPDLWKGSYPYWAKDGRRAYFIVPAASCKTCEFHEPAKRYGRNRYAACRWFRANNDIPTGLQMLANAVEETRKIMGQDL